MTLVVAIMLSALVSLTFTPMLCARLLRPSLLPGHGFLDRALDGLVRAYGRALAWVLEHRTQALSSSRQARWWSRCSWCRGSPKGFFPTQDTG